MCIWIRELREVFHQGEDLGEFGMQRCEKVVVAGEGPKRGVVHYQIEGRGQRGRWLDQARRPEQNVERQHECGVTFRAGRHELCPDLEDV